MKFFNRFDKNALFILLEGIAFTMVVYLYNPYIQLFAKRMGAGDLHIALINSLPPLVAILVLIPCGFLIERLNRKKITTMFLIFLNSLFYAAIAFVPFMPDKLKVLVYVILIGLMNMPGSLYQTTWQPFSPMWRFGGREGRVPGWARPTKVWARNLYLNTSEYLSPNF